jgi:hypothetical protein
MMSDKDDEQRLRDRLEVERLKSLARMEDTLPAADDCTACRTARERSGDPSFLCDEHLRRIYGV